MQRWALLSLTGLIGTSALLGWREWRHAAAREEWSKETNAQFRQVEQLEAAVQTTREANAALTEAVAEMEATEQSLEDRAANLEAQREHLQAEVKRQRDRVQAAEAGAESARAELENARQALLEQSARPRQLEGNLEQARLRMDEMETALDSAALSLAEGPSLLTVEDLSSDRSVFSLAGTLPRTTDLPLPVYLCRRDSVVLEGWIHRRQDGLAIGHVLGWREPASTLVKGEKVFILPKQHYEAEP